MRILLAHNYYGSSAPSGENTVFEAELDLLRAHGHCVTAVTRHSDTLRSRGVRGALLGAASTPWNPRSRRSVKRLLEEERAEVLHVHNSFPLLSPSIYYAAEGATANVLTLHNFRCFCAAGIPMRKGQPCTACLDRRSILPGLVRGCYRHSRLATFPLALMIGLHRALGTWARRVDAFVALSEFQRDLMVRAGLPRERVHVKPHFYPDPPAPQPLEERQPKVVFLGRLGPEKGVHVLIDAWARWGRGAPTLEVIGSGPELDRLRTRAREAGVEEKVSFLGQLPFPEAQEALSTARLLALPSLCFEGFPMVVREAFALGVPVAASRLGPMPGLVSHGANGLLFEPGDAADLAATLRTAWSEEGRLQALGRGARDDFERKYTAETNHDVLLEIYRQAAEHRRRRGCGTPAPGLVAA